MHDEVAGRDDGQWVGRACCPRLGRPLELSASWATAAFLPHLPALYLLLTGAKPTEGRRRRTRRGADARHPVSGQEVTGYLREREITLTYHPVAGTLQAGTSETAKTSIRKAASPGRSAPLYRKEEKRDCRSPGTGGSLRPG
jgi:hypothetical protein